MREYTSSARIIRSCSSARSAIAARSSRLSTLPVGYCGELMMSLSKPVDIVDLSVPCKFIDLVLEEGVVLYG